MIILNKFIPKFNFIICLILNAALTVWRNQDAHPIGTAVNKLPECSGGAGCYFNNTGYKFPAF